MVSFVAGEKAKNTARLQTLAEVTIQRYERGCEGAHGRAKFLKYQHEGHLKLEGLVNSSQLALAC